MPTKSCLFSASHTCKVKLSKDIDVNYNDYNMSRYGKIEIYSVGAAAGTADHMDYRKDMESQAAHWSHLLRGERAGHRRLALLLFLGASLFGGLSLYPALGSLGGVSLWTA